jgi:predicted metalloprotease
MFSGIDPRTGWTTRGLGYAWAAMAGLLPALAAAAGAQTASDATLKTTRALFQDAQAFWTQQIAAFGGRYRPATLTYFSGHLDPICSVAAPVVGPFYCPDAETVYLEQGFLQHLAERADGAADVALGYVAAHELAHHVQSLLGTTQLVDEARERSTRERAAHTLTTFELQADCYAGLWLRWAQQRRTIVPPADFDAVLDAVAASSQWQHAQLRPGELVLDPLTHGTAVARLKWLHVGLDSGDFNACDTFGAEAAGKL